MPSILTLPVETVAQIVSNMSIRDSQSLSAWAPQDILGDRVRAACNDRLCTANYLRDNFGHGVELLESMSKHTVYLSGSRSLEFFVPGSLGSNSDWDFYIKERAEVVYSFMSDMVKMGVSWETPLQELEEALREGDSERHVLFSALQYKHHFENGHFQQLAARYQRLPVFQLVTPQPVPTGARGLPTHLRILVKVTEDGLESERWLESDNGTDDDSDDDNNNDNHIEYQSIGCVINGHINRPEGKVKVQLILEQALTYMDCPSVLKYHSSCVQSVVGPHLACHFYGTMTFDKLSYAWRVGEARSRKAHAKYQERGFQYVDRDPDTYRLRCANDEHATLVDRKRDTDAPVEIVRIYQEYIKSTSWQELANEVHPIHAVKRPFMALHQSSWLVQKCSDEALEILLTHGCVPCFRY